MFFIKFFGILMVIACCGRTVFSQGESTMVGSIAVKGGAGYVYKLHFKDSAGVITGYSITDVGGPNETRTAITGSISKSGKELVFRETKLLKTKSVAKRDSFCYVQAKLKLKRSRAIKGSFTGYMSDGKTQCATGDIVLYGTADIVAKLAKMGLKIDTASAAKKEVLGTTGQLPKPPVKLQVSPGETLELSGESKTATLEVWDEMNIDGDVISIIHNDRVILERYRLETGRKKLDIKLSGIADTITLIAQNEGAEPPNTARLKLVSGNTTYYLSASTQINKPAHIIIKPKAP